MSEETSAEAAEENASDVADNADDTSEIKETDIVFDCPQCGKSLAIDYRGAGLSIPCSDCGSIVEVPIPEGLQITDIDSAEQDAGAAILSLRRSLAAADLRIRQLEAEIAEINERRETLEKSRRDNIYQFGQILEKVGLTEKHLRDVAQTLDKIAVIAKESR